MKSVTNLGAAPTRESKARPLQPTAGSSAPQMKPRDAPRDAAARPRLISSQFTRLSDLKSSDRLFLSLALICIYLFILDLKHHHQKRSIHSQWRQESAEGQHANLPSRPPR